MKIQRTNQPILAPKSFTKRIVNMVIASVLIPVASVAILASLYYYLGIESLFSRTIEDALYESVKVAGLYFNEHKDSIKSDLLYVANDLDKNLNLLYSTSDEINNFLDNESYLRNLPEIMIFTKNKIIGHNALSFPLLFETFGSENFTLADSGEIIILDKTEDDKVRAMVKINDYYDDYSSNVYIMVGRYIDADILNYLQSTKGSVTKYNELWYKLKRTQIQVVIAFIGISIALCMISVYGALRFAKKIIMPIRSIVSATAQVSNGNFDVRVTEPNTQDEIMILSRGFNIMTQKIANQTNDLLQANNLLHERTTFIEMVLKEISSGIIVLNNELKIALLNDAACKMLDIKASQCINKEYENFLPELKEFIEHICELDNQSTLQSIENDIKEKNIVIKKGLKERHFFVRVGRAWSGNTNLKSYIINLDDMTDIIKAQKSEAWGDVARRVAHEIKNPLTPIQLAAEQIARKISSTENSNKEAINRYINTIINHVSDIGKIVSDFINFANYAKPVLKTVNLLEIIDAILFSYGTTTKRIKYLFDKKDEACYVSCDKTQLSQVVLNLIKNGAEAIEAKRLSLNIEVEGRLMIGYCYSTNRQYCLLFIKDDGCGFSYGEHDIMEPYVTTKVDGSGLGLPIVKNIIENHSGSFFVVNNSDANHIKDICNQFDIDASNLYSRDWTEGAVSIVVLPAQIN